MLNIIEPDKTEALPLLSLGFRPFFLGAAGFSVLAMLLWMYIYLLDQQIAIYHLPASIWHGHEMIYGYGLAVIAGFLLTAVQNWTNKPMPSGVKLMLLFGLWLMGRMVNLMAGLLSMELVAVLDTLFLVFLSVTIAIPIVNTRQWGNLSIVAVLICLLVGNCLFYAGLLGMLPQGIYWGLYVGLYLTLTLIFVMGRRVIPFFIQQGVGYPVELKNNRWLDVFCIAFFIVFFITELLLPNHLIVSLLAGLLFFLHGFRLIGWYTDGIWRQPLLWALYLGYACLVAAFALKWAVYWLAVPADLSLHAFAYGGIGLITMAMMSRVSLGHSGRKVDQPPQLLFWLFPILFVGVIVRAIFPLFDPARYEVWVFLSQLFWVMAFCLFLYTYFPILTKRALDS